MNELQEQILEYLRAAYSAGRSVTLADLARDLGPEAVNVARGMSRLTITPDRSVFLEL